MPVHGVCLEPSVRESSVKTSIQFQTLLEIAMNQVWLFVNPSKPEKPRIRSTCNARSWHSKRVDPPEGLSRFWINLKQVPLRVAILKMCLTNQLALFVMIE
jgi:hypothetical protein